MILAQEVEAAVAAVVPLHQVVEGALHIDRLVVAVAAQPGGMYPVKHTHKHTHSNIYIVIYTVE